VRPDGREHVVVACDTVSDGVHTDLAYATPWDVGYKSLAVNVSDFAAMGAVPESALVALSLPRNSADSLIEGLASGFSDCAREHGVGLLGGDTTRSPGRLTMSVTLLGRTANRRLMKRSGAREGDLLFVTGPLGGAHAGLRLLERWKKKPPGHGKARGRLENVVAWARELSQECVERHLAPRARLGEGQLLAALAVRCCVDVSDGLVSDCGHIAKSSGLAVEIELSEVPRAEGVRQVARSVRRPAVEFALYGGEDYELVYTVRPARAGRVADELESLTSRRPVRIGRVVRGRGVWLIRDGKRRRPTTTGYVHF
jgi:thiamine-monophosphate kinase